MSHFPDFIASLEQFKQDNDIKLSYAESRRYGWRLGSEAKSDLQEHIEETWPDADPQQKENFKLMFEPGRDLMGIQILSIIPGNTVYLLESTEKSHLTSCTIAQFWENKIYAQQTMKCPILKSNFYWPIAIKIGSVNIKDSSKEYFDINENASSGAITYNSNIYTSKDVYVNGKLDYKSGLMTLTRFSKKNDETYDKLLAKQGSGGSSGGSGSSSGGASEIFTKDSDNLNISFIAYEGPVKKIFEFSI